MHLKGYVRNLIEVLFRDLSRRRKGMKSLSQDNQYSSTGFNRVPSECKSIALPLDQSAWCLTLWFPVCRQHGCQSNSSTGNKVWDDIIWSIILQVSFHPRNCIHKKPGTDWQNSLVRGRPCYFILLHYKRLVILRPWLYIFVEVFIIFSNKHWHRLV
jgi:hypothetical protein